MADQLITFRIYLQDEEVVRAKQAQYPNGWIHGPEPAATELSDELGYTVDYQASDEPFVAPCVRTPYNPTGSSGKFFTDRAVFTINNGGFWGFFGASTRFIWVGYFEYSAPATPPDPPGVDPPPAPVALAQTRNLCGFEIPGDASTTAEGGSGSAPQWISRDSSRTLEGMGFCYRGLTTQTLVKTPSDHISPAPTPNTTWERMYIRIRALPSSPQGFWRTAGTPSGGSGTLMQITPSGTVQVTNSNATSVHTVMGQSAPLELNRWYRLDTIQSYNPSAAQFTVPPPPPAVRIPTYGTFYLYVDGMAELHYRADDVNMGGIGDNTSRIQSSTIGPYSGVTLAGLELDIDDWVIKELPTTDADGRWSGLDWLNGSHCQLVLPDAFGAGHANWVGDFRALLNLPATGSTARITSSTSGAIMSALTDVEFSAESRATVLGIQAMIVALFSSRASVDGTLGWSINGGAFDLATIVQSTSIQWNKRLYRPAGQLVPLSDLAPLELRHVKGASAGASSVGALMAVVELIGTFGAEDVFPGIRYPQNSPWTLTWFGLPREYRVGDRVTHGGGNYICIATALQKEPPNATYWDVDPNLAFEIGDRVYQGRNLDSNSGENHRYRCIQAHSDLRIPDESPDYWEVEDPLDTLPAVGPHNAPYPSTPWAGAAAPPISPVGIIGGTYVGNGTGQDIIFRFPVHFLWVRPLTGDTGGTHWWTSMIGAHRNYQYRIEAENMVQAMMDPDYVSAGGDLDTETRAKIRIAGSNTQSNANGVTYQYIAFCDPGERFLTNGSFAHGSNPQITEAANFLIDSGFTPEAAFFIIEQIGVTSTNSMYYKGPGYGVYEGQEVVSTAVNTNLAEFHEGEIRSKTPLHVSSTQQTAYAAWRKDDGTGDPGVPSVLKIGSYVGNGVASRSIAVSPASGKRPLWLFVIAHGSGASGSLFRDPSHTGTTSTNVGNGTSNASTGITGGDIDSFTVGSSLNTNGVIYDYIMFMGSATAGNGGWSINGEFIPVVPAPAPGDNYPPGPDYDPDDPEAPLEPEEPPPTGGGDEGDGDGPTLTPPTLDDDLEDAACITPSTTLVNLALRRIGINIPIVTLETEQSAEAAAVRAAYDQSLQETLVAVPWPFATRYATLTLLAGTSSVAANEEEWQFAYRIPNDCLFPRRLVTDRGTAVNPTPPPMRLASGVLLTNQANARLEYTARVNCPALAADPLFRSTWAWRLAAELAPALTRMADRAQQCMEMYELGLEKARRVIRLGAPGTRPTQDAYGLDVECEDVKLQAINMALVRIGAQTIANLYSDQSRESTAAIIVYEDELRATLREYNWPFATRYAELVLVDGALDDFANADWAFAYRMPEDAIAARRLVKDLATTAVGRGFDPDPFPFSIGSDAIGQLLFTNVEDAVLEYTIRPACALRVGDSMFRDAFAWRLAAALAPSLAMPDPEAEEQTGRAPAVDSKAPRPSEGGKVQLQRMRLERARWAWAMYERSLSVAETASGNEQQAEKDGDASWIRDRS